MQLLTALDSWSHRNGAGRPPNDGNCVEAYSLSWGSAARARSPPPRCRGPPAPLGTRSRRTARAALPLPVGSRSATCSGTLEPTVAGPLRWALPSERDGRAARGAARVPPPAAEPSGPAPGPAPAGCRSRRARPLPTRRAGRHSDYAGPSGQSARPRGPSPATQSGTSLRGASPAEKRALRPISGRQGPSALASRSGRGGPRARARGFPLPLARARGRRERKREERRGEGRGEKLRRRRHHHHHRGRLPAPPSCSAFHRQRQTEAAPASPPPPPRGVGRAGRPGPASDVRGRAERRAGPRAL